MSTPVVSLTDFATYLNNDSLNEARAAFILDVVQEQCESFVSPLPPAARWVILAVAERAYANPTPTGAPTYYAEGEGPLSDGTPGRSGGGLYLTLEDVAALQRLAGRGGGAFTIDTTPAGAGTGLPWWDTGSVFPTGDWDVPA